MINILNESVIRIEKSSGARTESSLPEVYAALMTDQVGAFPALRPHQRHAWHAFLAQLGGMAMHRANVDRPPDDAKTWSKLIRGLTPDYPDDEPWQLVVPGITEPAFMQPPARTAEKEKEYKSVVATPDALDMLVTSKNHDLKAIVGALAAVDDWIFALITLQTMEGFGGARNYGISRMPSGYGNRPAFSFSPAIGPGAHIRRDLDALLEHRQGILDEYEVKDGGISLLWTRPWDGTQAESLLINQLEPFYIEVCRRIRLRKINGKFEAVRANSLSRRIVDVKGLTGDPWAPVGKSVNQKDTPPAFLGQRKFSYERIVDGMFSPDWKEPCLLRLTQYDRNSDGTMYLIARGLVRGEGRTGGYHERIIPLRPKTVQIFGQPSGPSKLEDVARERITDTHNIQRILQHAIATFAAHGNGDRGTHRNGRPSPNDLARPWVQQLDEIVDSHFFDDLQIEFEAVDDNERKRIRSQWLQDFVVANANRVLNDSWNFLACPDSQRIRASATSQNIFNGRLCREFNVVLDQPLGV